MSRRKVLRQAEPSLHVESAPILNASDTEPSVDVQKGAQGKHKTYLTAYYSTMTAKSR